MERFNGDNELDCKRPGRSTLRTKEGKAAVAEAIEFLKNQEPSQPFKFSGEMMEAAKAHVEDIGPKG